MPVVKVVDGEIKVVDEDFLKPRTDEEIKEKIEENKKKNPPIKISFTDRLAIKSLVDMFIKYDTKFKAEAALLLHKERKVLNKHITQYNADDYYRAQCYDNYSLYISTLYTHHGIDSVLTVNQLDPSNIVMYTMLLEEERMKHDLKALSIKIKDIEIAFAMTVELLHLIIIKLNELGFNTKIVSNDTLIWLYCDIVSGNGRAITFIGEEHLETYMELRKIFLSILMPEYVNRINSYIKYRED